MTTEDYKPHKARSGRKPSHDDLLKVVAYIVDEWERESPGTTANVDPAVLQRDLLRFMRQSGIKTIADYEEMLIKL